MFAVDVPHRVRVALRALVASVSLLVIIGSGIAWATFKNFTSDVPHGAPVPALSAGEHDPDGADQNILLIGDDTRAGATDAELTALHAGHDKSTVNADTMMVLHIPSGNGAPTLVSFPRDSWVRLPGYGRGKINAAYPDAYNHARARHEGEVSAESAGIIETIRTIHALTGLYIDHYMQVSMLGFYRISEAIGGVTVCLKHAENKSTDKDAFGSGYSGIDLPKGVSVIKGAQALAFVRQRHGLPHGDLDRIKRQQYFLRAAFSKITSAGMLLNPFKLHELLTAVGKSLLTDPALDLLGLARQFESLTSGKISFVTLPNNGPTLIYPDGVETAIVLVNRAAIPAFVRSLAGADDSALRDAKPAAPRSVTVDVLNGTDVLRLAAHNAAALHRFGFRIDIIDSTDTTPSTEVEYPPGKEAQAKAVLAHVAKAKPVATPDVDRVTLVLGANGVVADGVRAPVVAHSGHPKHAKSKASAGITCID
jgi:LCP family protein required for cell wall assembly